MKITVWGINYAPELTGIAPYNTVLCKFLRAQGHEARMVTAFPYYPAWRKIPGDGGRLYRTDEMEGVPVHRCWHYVPARLSTFKRILHEGSFVATSWLRLLTLPRPDVLVVVSPPLLLGAAAWALGWLKRCPFVFHVQDLQPDAAAGLVMLNEGWLLRSLYWLEELAYRKARRVSGIMHAMLDAFRRHGVAEEKVFFFPNGVTLPSAGELPARHQFRQRHGFGAEDFLVVYSGNLGVKQGLEVLIEAARLLKDPRVRILLGGDGARREALAKQVAHYQLANVRLLPLQPEAHYREMLADADLCVITQQRGSGRYFFPSKLMTTLAFARPVLSVTDADSELARSVNAGGFGVNIEPGHAGKLAAQIESLARQPAVLAEWGRAGRRYVGQFDFSVVLRDFEQALQQAARPQAAPGPVASKVQHAPK